MLKGTDLAKAILKAKDRYALLSLGSEESIAVEDGYLNIEDEAVRKVYTKMAAQVHPDRLRGFSQATEAFQALVRAYELCCKPELRADESDDSRESDDDDDDEEEESDESDDESESEQAAAVAADSSDEEPPEADSEDELLSCRVVKYQSGARPAAAARKASPAPKPTKKAKARKSPGKHSNAGAHRTCVRCPRCAAEWGDHLRSEGAEHFFSDFMQGRRQVHCLSCLFEFGCLTAGHGCPFCKRPFEYRCARPPAT
jgi:curved DNA-binding protein CbpA